MVNSILDIAINNKCKLYDKEKRKDNNKCKYLNSEILSLCFLRMYNRVQPTEQYYKTDDLKIQSNYIFGFKFTPRREKNE